MSLMIGLVISAVIILYFIGALTVSENVKSPTIIIITIFIVLVYALTFYLYRESLIIDVDENQDIKEIESIYEAKQLVNIDETEQLIADYLDVPQEEFLIEKRDSSGNKYNVIYGGDNFIVVVKDNKIAKFVEN